MGQNGSALGKKIQNDFDVIGRGVAEGWEKTKAFGKKAWEGVKSIPVLGQVASGLDKAGEYVGLGNITRGITSAIDTGVGATRKILGGDVSGALGRITQGARDVLDIRKPQLVRDAEKVPILGDIINKAYTGLENAPLAGGMSLNALRSIGNAAANSVDALRGGDVIGGLKAGLEGAKTFGQARGGLAGKIATNVDRAQGVINKVETAQRVIKTLRQ
jgi:hypothetical protein